MVITTRKRPVITNTSDPEKNHVNDTFLESKKERMSSSSTCSSSSSSNQGQDNKLNIEDITTTLSCTKCSKRVSKQHCSQNSCLKCCTDEACIVHAITRAQAMERASILHGTHVINQLAKEKRSKAIRPGTFHESSFHYIGDSVILWSLKDYMAEPKRRNDAIRKSKKRNRSQSFLSLQN